MRLPAGIFLGGVAATGGSIRAVEVSALPWQRNLEDEDSNAAMLAMTSQNPKTVLPMRQLRHRFTGTSYYETV